MVKESTLPGTALARGAGLPAGALLEPMFLTGGLVLSQVAAITGLEGYVIQNWVKRGCVSPPKGKRYSRRQVGRILMINLLKDALQLDRITRLLSYVNGHLDDESDDLIDDFELYLAAVGLMDRLEGDAPPDPQALSQCCYEALKDYVPARPGARERVAKALEVVLVAHAAARLKTRAEGMLAALDGEYEERRDVDECLVGIPNDAAADLSVRGGTRHPGAGGADGHDAGGPGRRWG